MLFIKKMFWIICILLLSRGKKSKESFRETTLIHSYLKVINLAAEKHVRGAVTRQGSPDFLQSAAEIQTIELCYLPAVNWFCCHISTRNAELQLEAA